MNDKKTAMTEISPRQGHLADWCLAKISLSPHVGPGQKPAKVLCFVKPTVHFNLVPQHDLEMISIPYSAYIFKFMEIMTRLFFFLTQFTDLSGLYCDLNCSCLSLCHWGHVQLPPCWCVWDGTTCRNNYFHLNKNTHFNACKYVCTHSI